MDERGGFGSNSVEHIPGVSDEARERSRACADCGQTYSIQEYAVSAGHYFNGPEKYINGCFTHCLSCWLGVGPELDEYEEPSILQDCGGWLPPGSHLVLMPLDRVHLDYDPIRYDGIIFYPPEHVDLELLNVSSWGSNSLAGKVSRASGIDSSTIAKHATVAFAAKFDWDNLWQQSYKTHRQFIRKLSEFVDKRYLDLARFRLCQLDLPDTLPGRAGQVASNYMMAAVIVYNAADQEARIIGSDAFSHRVVRGLGLPLVRIDESEFPKEGELGNIVQHALSLYTQLIEANSDTSKFIQALALLEYLADPEDYLKFKKVAKVVARYVARDKGDYHRVEDRFFELTGRKDPKTQECVGYRTRIIHIGERLEELVPDERERAKLFIEVSNHQLSWWYGGEPLKAV